MNTSTIVSHQDNKLQDTSIDELADEIKGLVVEGEFDARWKLLETYYKVGKALETFIGITDMQVSKVTATVAVKAGVSERSLYYALKMVRKYDDINKLPEGKAITWKRLVTKYLTDSPKKEELEVVDQNLIKCPNCGFMFSRQDM
jgi:hypothetical protein